MLTLSVHLQSVSFTTQHSVLHEGKLRHRVLVARAQIRHLLLLGQVLLLLQHVLVSDSEQAAIKVRLHHVDLVGPDNSEGVDPDIAELQVADGTTDTLSHDSIEFILRLRVGRGNKDDVIGVGKVATKGNGLVS